MDHATRHALIVQYQNGYAEIAAALEGVTEAELDVRPAPDDWTVREIVHHLADSETTSTIRLRRLLAEEKPAILGYDEREFARRLHYDRPLGASLDLFRAVRVANSELLDTLSEEEWQRSGTHSENGAYGVEIWLEIYADHAHAHATQIQQARQAAR